MRACVNPASALGSGDWEGLLCTSPPPAFYIQVTNVYEVPTLWKHSAGTQDSLHSSGGRIVYMADSCLPLSPPTSPLSPCPGLRHRGDCSSILPHLPHPLCPPRVHSPHSSQRGPATPCLQTCRAPPCTLREATHLAFLTGQPCPPVSSHFLTLSQPTGPGHPGLLAVPPTGRWEPVWCCTLPVTQLKESSPLLASSSVYYITLLYFPNSIHPPQMFLSVVCTPPP